MRNNLNNKKKKTSRIQSKLIKYIWILILPLLLLFGFSVVKLFLYYQDYDRLVRNITSANEYNMSFKDSMDESMYRIIIGNANWTNPEEKLGNEDPKALISSAVKHFEELKEKTTEDNVRSDLEALIRLLGILDERVDDILKNVEEGGHYDENMEMLDMNIRTLTSLIQEDIQKYIYDEATNMEMLRRDVARSLLTTIRMIVLLLLIIVFLISVFSKRLSRRITEPITELCDMTEKFAGGDFSVSCHIDSNDEMQTLAESFNSMVQEIKTLVEDIHREQENAKDAELRLLQEQINPHFLYNTLDAIVWMTEAGEKQKAIQVIQELSSFFRISLSKGASEITIRSEREHVKNYLEIQRFRYQDILDYELDFDEEIMNYLIQKLTLQPIVENAIYHGIKNKRGGGKIKVSGRLGDDGNIHFIIEDNGRGMNEEELMRLRGLISGEIVTEDKNGFGMANVEKRLEMQYGEAYGITVESELDVGTKVYIKIPRVSRAESNMDSKAELNI